VSAASTSPRLRRLARAGAGHKDRHPRADHILLPPRPGREPRRVGDLRGAIAVPIPGWCDSRRAVLGRRGGAAHRTDEPCGPSERPDVRSPSGPSRRAQTYRRQQESLAALPAGRGRPLPPLAGPLLDRCGGRGGSPALLPMLKALLLGDGALCRWDHLEPIVGDRLTAFDREPVVSASQAVLGALERG